MNLLIALAVGEISELTKRSEVTEFQSTVVLIPEYSIMFPHVIKHKQKRTLGQLFVSKRYLTYRSFCGSLLFWLSCGICMLSIKSHLQNTRLDLLQK